MIMQGEFIGHELTVVNSSNNTLVGITGKILDETKESFTIRTDKELQILKKGSTFQIENLTIAGNKITKRPEERLKLK